MRNFTRLLDSLFAEANQLRDDLKQRGTDKANAASDIVDQISEMLSHGKAMLEGKDTGKMFVSDELVTKLEEERDAAISERDKAQAKLAKAETAATKAKRDAKAAKPKASDTAIEAAANPKTSDTATKPATASTTRRRNRRPTS